LFGIAACNIEERAAAARGELTTTPLQFINCEALPYGGVLFLLPFLLETGLLSFKSHYRELDAGYYYIDLIVLLTAFMYLCRIKNPEQFKNVNPGDFGKLLGLDRIPEAKCFRQKIKQISAQQKGAEWNMELAKSWSETEQTNFYYIDGHIQQYHGHKANLGKKFISRQKLCLPGIQEFWVNNKQGMPYFYVTGQVNEKLQEMIESQIVPMLVEQLHPVRGKDPDQPCFTIVFDREAYSPQFFDQLWQQHRVAVITYRKNVSDSWKQGDFKEYIIPIEGDEVTMQLAEKETILDGVKMREIRKLNTGSHQTSVITTHPSLDILTVALYMFARWSQENFFRYMRQDYVFDKISQYTVEQIDETFQVVNPTHRKLTHQLQKTREKIQRRNAHLFLLKEESANTSLDKTASQTAKQQKVQAELDEFRKEESDLLKQRQAIPYKTTIRDIGDNKYNKLHTESKLFLNVIKMICYRAETSLANLLATDYKKHINEKRMLVKSLINTPCDLFVDHSNNTLNVNLYSLATPRDNLAISKICTLINESNCIYPGTNLRLVYNSTTSKFTSGQEV
jgi:hypothetical protein